MTQINAPLLAIALTAGASGQAFAEDVRNLAQRLVDKNSVLLDAGNDAALAEIYTEGATITLVCKDPDIRTIMAQAASRYELSPRTISFKGTLQTLEALQPMLAIRGESSRLCRRRLYEQLLEAIVTHRVGDRPDLIEPRRIKRRHKHYVRLSVPRAEAKHQILKGLSKN